MGGLILKKASLLWLKNDFLTNHTSHDHAVALLKSSFSLLVSCWRREIMESIALSHHNMKIDNKASEKQTLCVLLVSFIYLSNFLPFYFIWTE